MHRYVIPLISCLACLCRHGGAQEQCATYHDDCEAGIPEAMSLLQNNILLHKVLVQKSKRKAALCLEGKAVPELYLLGENKCGTSSFASDLRASLGISAAPDDTRKEWGFFWHAWEAGENITDPQKMKDLWIHSLPSCSNDVEHVMADFSPGNAVLVPLPAEYAVARELWMGPMKRHVVNAAKTFHSFYGQASKQLSFVILLREPLSRMHSAWYYDRSDRVESPSCGGCVAGANFQDSLARTMREARQGRISDWLWKSFYARHLEEYLNYFDASQFSIIPRLQYFQPHTTKAVCKHMAGLLNLDHHSCWTDAATGNTLEHPPLSADIEFINKTVREFNDLIAKENARLVTVLARAQFHGAWLANFVGTPGSKVDIQQWLEASW